MRHGRESNPCIGVLQTPALPLGYRAIYPYSATVKKKNTQPPLYPFCQRETNGWNDTKRSVFADMVAAQGFFSLQKSKCLLSAIFGKDGAMHHGGMTRTIQLDIRDSDKRFSMGNLQQEVRHGFTKYCDGSAGRYGMRFHIYTRSHQKRQTNLEAQKACLQMKRPLRHATALRTAH